MVGLTRECHNVGVSLDGKEKNPGETIIYVEHGKERARPKIKDPAVIISDGRSLKKTETKTQGGRD